MTSWAITEPVATLAGPPTTTTHRVGDLAIEFCAGQPTSRRGGAAAWAPVAVEPEWRLWQQPPSADWKGFPLTEIQVPGWQIWLLGELYGGRGGAQTCAPALVEIVRGRRAAAELNGHLLLLAWDEGWRQWHVWTNRFGTLHAYYAAHGGVAALGTHFPAIARLASRRQLDWSALTGFFGFGFFPEARTFYEDASILRPATHYVFSAQGEEISAQRYWEWSHAPDLKRSYDDTVAEFARVFGSVMAELLEEGPRTTDYRLLDQPTAAVSCQSSVVGGPATRIALPLSGGLDSRSTAAALTSDLWPLISGRLWSYSYGYSEDSVETRIARQVAAARGLPFAPFTIQPYLFERLHWILGAVEGFQDLTQCRQAFVAEPLGHDADFVIAAHWGDVWLDTMGLAARRRGDDWTTGLRDNEFRAPNSQKSVVSRHRSGSEVLTQTLHKVSKPGRAWLLTNLCAPHLGQESPERLLVRFVQSGLDRLQHLEDPDFRVKAFKTDHWSFRWTLASLRMFQAAAFPRLPFYDTRLADFFATVPSVFMSGRQLQIDYLKRFAPDLAGIEWQVRGADLYHCQQRGVWPLARRAGNKVRRLITNRKPIERNWEVQFSGQPGQAGLEHWLLRPGLRLHELVSKAEISNLLQDFKAEPLKEGRGYTVSMLLSFSVWLEKMETTDF